MRNLAHAIKVGIRGLLRILKFHGTITVKGKDGITALEYGLKWGILHGEFKTFYASGKLQTVTHYINGNIEGKTIMYYENGVVMHEMEHTLQPCNAS